MTPRTVWALLIAADVLHGYAVEDIKRWGDTPVDPKAGWQIFDAYPRITWRQSREWRLKAAEAFVNLQEDLDAGIPPRPRTFAEEMALHLMLDETRESVPDWLDDNVFPALPSYPEDFDWTDLEGGLFQDTDILDLFDNQKDGVEDPSSSLNQGLAMGDMRPAAWFNTFLNRKPREISAT